MSGPPPAEPIRPVSSISRKPPIVSADTPPQPSPSPISPIPAKSSIDLHSALVSTVRAWLASRDSILWLLSSGAALSSDDVLDPIELTDAIELSHRMNELRKIALGFASQLADRDRTAYAVLRHAVDSLLESESPKFLLRSDAAPGSF